MGQSGTTLDVVYDTGSDWLCVEGANCSNCEGDTFDGTASGVRIDAQESQKDYGSASLTGHTYKDRVCIDDLCVNDFEYFLINSQKGVNGYAGILEPVDGILGMSRDLVPEEYGDYEIGPLFVKALSATGHT